MLCSPAEHERSALALLETEYSRRLLLLRAIVDGASSRADATGLLAPLDTAWELLARAQRHAPQAVHRLLMDPQTGLWAAHLLRRLRGSATDSAPLWCDVGQLHALAAAAAVLAGLDFRLHVPVRQATVTLPGLGRARLAAREQPEPWGVAQVSGHGGSARVVLDDTHVVRSHAAPAPHVVQLPSDPSTDGPGWSGMRHLRLSHDGLVLTLALDDLGLYPVVAGSAPPARLEPAAARRWQQRLERAWALLVQDHRDSAAALAAGLLSLVPLPPGERFRPRSVSASEAFGCVMLSEPDTDVDDHGGTVQLAVTLVHEFRHTLLNGLMHLAPLTDDCTDLFHAPWRDDPRPLTGLAHGAFAFSGVARFWRARCALDSGRERDLARFEFALWRLQTRTVLELLDSQETLTATGRTLVRGLRSEIETWDDDPLPPSSARLAERAAAHQRALWRAHHLLPSPETVRAAAESWLSEAEPPTAVARCDGTLVRTDPAGCRLDVFAHLARLMIVDPRAFAAARDGDLAGDAVLRGVTRADLAYVAGDAAQAEELYAQETFDSARPGAWGGFGLLLAARHAADDDGTDGTACRSLAERPHLVRAVARTIAQRAGRAVPAAELFGWLARAWRAEDPGAVSYNGSGSMSQSARCSQSTA